MLIFSFFYTVLFGTGNPDELRTGKYDLVQQGRVVRKPINANPGLKVNRGNNFSRITVLSVAYVLCSLRLLMLKTEGQKVLIALLTEKPQK